MILVDVHAHMDMEQYNAIGGVGNVLNDCKKNSVKVIVANGINIDSNRKVLEMAKEHDIIRPALGIYPTDCLEMMEQGMNQEFYQEINFIEKKIKEKKCFAIGEVGLEYTQVTDLNEEKKNIMKECLKKFIEVAKKYDVPIILHTRGAELDVVELLESEGMKDKKVIIHCFSGRKNVVKRIRDNGWTFSIPCSIIRAQQFQDIVKDTPIQQLLTETDSPYLSPYKDKVNTPANVSFTIDKIAEIKKLTPEETANIIYSNYQRLFL